jgi:hypothetical protein
MDTDLDAPILQDRDPIEKIELGLPFCRSLIKTFVDHVRDAEKAAGGQGFVTVATLSEQFTSPAWNALLEQDSKLVRVLQSDAFKDPKKNQTLTQIDMDYLILFGIIHCQGNPTDKAEQWFDVLQEGGREAHEMITSNDKDFEPVFMKMCEFVTKDIFTDFARIHGLERKYGRSDLDAINKNSIDILREDGYLDDVFGANSRLEYDAWIANTATNALYMFNGKELRNKVLAHVELDFRY